MQVSTILRGKGRSVVVCSPDDRLSRAIDLLAEHRIGALVVMQGEQLVGILSERDIVRLLASQGAAALDTDVGSSMTALVVTCAEEASIDAVMAIMNSQRFRHMPVVRNGRLVGLVSMGDVAREHIAAVENEAHEMRAYISAS